MRTMKILILAPPPLAQRSEKGEGGEMINWFIEQVQRALFHEASPISAQRFDEIADQIEKAAGGDPEMSRAGIRELGRRYAEDRITGAEK